MELELDRQERVNAPLQLVWEELDTLDQLLAKTPQVSDIEVVPGGQRARGKARLAWGPVKWTVDLDVELVDFVPRQRVGYCIGAAGIETRATITITLTSIGEAETRLDYRGTVDVRHRMASRMRGLFNEMLEDQAHSLLHRVKVKSEQRRLAQERLLK